MMLVPQGLYIFKFSNHDDRTLNIQLLSEAAIIMDELSVEVITVSRLVDTV